MDVVESGIGYSQKSRRIAQSAPTARRGYQLNRGHPVIRPPFVEEMIAQKGMKARERLRAFVLPMPDSNVHSIFVHSFPDR